MGIFHASFLRSVGKNIEKTLRGPNFSGFDGTRNGCSGPWWSATDEDDDTANLWTLGKDTFEIKYHDRSSFFSVRCIKED